MDRQILNFTANEQVLTVDEPIRISTNKVNYIEAHFSLGANWSGYDSVRAVWFNDYQTISTVLDSQGVCRVPFEVMKRKGQVKVDLVGSISEGNVLTDRLTSYPVVAVIVDCVAPITGAETSPITPSQFEQFVANVRADADRAEAGATSAETSAGESEASATASAQSATASANSASQAQTYAQNAQNYAASAETAKDDAIDAKEDAESAKADAESARDQILGMRATANTLAEGSDATASYSDGVLTLGIPRGNTGAKGDKGDKGDTGATPNLSIGTVETLPPTGQSQVTIAGTAENPVLNFKLVKGDTGEVTMAQLAQLLPTDTASGEIASWTDGTDVFPAVSVLTTIEPIQSGSGTPSPDNVRPISGHTECVTSVVGKNLYDDSTLIHGYFVDSTSITSNEAYRTISLNLKAGTYTLSLEWSQTARIIRKYTDGAITNLNRDYNTYTFTTTTDGLVMFCFRRLDSATITEDVKVQIELGTTVTDYEPYNGNTYTTSLGRTVYGGTLDVVSGELTVDRVAVDMGTLNWSKNTASSIDVGYYFSAPLANAIGADFGRILSAYPMSDKLGLTQTVQAYGSAIDHLAFVASNTNQHIIDSDYADATAFKTAMDGVQLVYELSTPQTYQLTPTEVQTLLGNNNLWTDCGSVNVTYKADTYLWVAKQLGQ